MISVILRDPSWVAVPADRDCYRQADGVLHVTTTDTNPSHLLYKGTEYAGAVQEVLARIRVKALAAGPNPIAGISVAANPDAAHAGEGINFIFINDPGDCLGAAGPVLRLVDDWRAWGPAVPEFYWKTDVWYWLRLGQTGREFWGGCEHPCEDLAAPTGPNRNRLIGRSSGPAMDGPDLPACAGRTTARRPNSKSTTS